MKDRTVFVFQYLKSLTGPIRQMGQRMFKAGVSKASHLPECLRRQVFFGILISVFLTGLPLATPCRAGAADGIVLGMSTALTGPAAILGINMRAGVLSALSEANRAGGFRGQAFSLISLDDGYEPSRTAPNMRTLIEEEQVLAVIGNVGTPTAVAAIPIANASKTPFFGAFTGAGVLRRNPPDRYVLNYRASYAEETSAMVNALIEFGGLKPNEIAFFTQRDAYGDAGYTGGMAALKTHGLGDETRIIHSRYERNTLAVENALADMVIANPQPRAVIMVGAYAPCGVFVTLAKQSGLDALFLNVSFVGGKPLAGQLGEFGDNVIITQVVPHFESDLPIVAEYHRALRGWDPAAKPTFGSLEGYITARIFLRALNTLGVGEQLTREAVVTHLEQLGDFDIGLGQPLHFGPDDHQACHTVWPTIIKNGRVIPFNWQNLGALLDSNDHE